MTVRLSDIEAARAAVAELARVTPLLHSRALSALCGADAWLKAEVLQRTGSFKVRGAAHMLRSMTPAERARGVVAASAGNHAQGVAVVAAHLGVSCHVVMPVGTALPKERATRDYGADVIIAGHDVGEAAVIAQRLAGEQGWTFVPPFDDARIVAGQGTLGLELLEQQPDLERVVVPVGGGGLAAGVALAVKSHRPGVEVIGVQAAEMASAARSFGGPTPIAVEVRPTLADGCAIPCVGTVTLPLLNRYVDQIVTVSEEWISLAMVWLLERTKVVVEGAGALGMAAILAGAIEPSGRRTAVVLSGGNIDVNLLARTVEHGLARAGRYLTLVITLRDRPGQLARVLHTCSEQGVNVLTVEHRRNTPALPVDAVEVELLVETRDADHAAAATAALEASGLVRIPGPGPVVRLADPSLPVS